MRAYLSEYLLKGVYLGLLFYVSLLDRDWLHTTELGLGIAIGLGAAIVLAFLIQIRDVVHLVRKPHTSLLFLLLENPLLIYSGLILGLTGAWMYAWDTGLSDKTFYFCVLGGLALGYGINELRGVPDWRYRIALICLVGLGLCYGIDGMFERLPSVPTEADRESIGAHLLFGLPFLYLLIFTAKAEESEADIGILCAFLGLALYLMKFPRDYPSGIFIIPLALFFTYTIYVLPSLRPFKHTLRGFCYMELHKIRPALISFRKALELDRNNRLAHQGMEAVHLKIDIDKLDAQTLGLLDRELCLNRARMLLNQKPSEADRIKAERFLNLVEKQWPKWVSHAIYFRAVLSVHQGNLDKACELLTDLLSPEGWFADDLHRKEILFDAWQLVLLAHPVLKQRVGDVQIQLPGRRMEAIGALERQIARVGSDPVLQEFRTLLYQDLREEEFWEVARENLPTDFGYGFAEQLGMGLIADRERWRRGAEFLRIAASGQPMHRPAIYHKLAEAHARASETIESSKYYRRVRDAAIEVGVENLPTDQKQVYIVTVKKLADESRLREEYDEAIYNYSLATYSDDGIKETLRSLADVYEKKKDVFNALRITEKALIYDSRDTDLLARKDKYYWSLEPEQLREAAKSDDNVRKYFDVEYCIKKGKQILDTSPADNLDNLDWAEHLLKLALVMQPGRMTAQVIKARCLLRRGERMEAVQILEDVREKTPSGTEESDAWYFTQKQLGLIYLDELSRPDLAVGCFETYLKHIGSGAPSLYDLGRAHEANGNIPEAIKAYNQVTAYEGHPLVWDAQEAVRRLKK